ncbi:hypothetical protein DLB98_20155 [Salmonella enterica subsp. enterica serovar Montevideo]|uniref:Uncharacterized protein n=1 Tax=Salmonella enterica subsp. enterica serovar Tamberma TaxID=2565079 RepID=A0A5X9FH10_SALET|nr:hypothetical protein [Salmonella enterica]EBU8006269.1 hypothetical protein [Salmonella enterica subsp. enterica serovar Montevideo]EBV4674251.1 hypothetical protein [Salmonella enterica subsp. enterica serovar Tamberma]EBV5085635.1 hypothetical protein [Salmonella enterica subsp. enterica serovar Minnesota]ECS6470348.1 hypothetical protein [Salmonella enterica subsp. enterica serovar Cotham]ECT9454847.1 hypothetical protein [Salmonella enterica subsp. enterica serovar Oskarshamn]ECV423215
MVEFDEVLCTGFFECCNYFVLSGPAAFGGGGCYLVFPDRRGRESAARAGLFSLSTGQAVNRLSI